MDLIRYSHGKSCFQILTDFRFLKELKNNPLYPLFASDKDFLDKIQKNINDLEPLVQGKLDKLGLTQMQQAIMILTCLHGLDVVDAAMQSGISLEELNTLYSSSIKIINENAKIEENKGFFNKLKIF